jgi:hypothetical protein
MPELVQPGLASCRSQQQANKLALEKSESSEQQQERVGEGRTSDGSKAGVKLGRGNWQEGSIGNSRIHPPDDHARV